MELLDLLQIALTLLSGPRNSGSTTGLDHTRKSASSSSRQTEPLTLTTHRNLINARGTQGLSNRESLNRRKPNRAG